MNRRAGGGAERGFGVERDGIGDGDGVMITDKETQQPARRLICGFGKPHSGGQTKW